MLRAIWRLAPTHHSNVYWATKSVRLARFIENGFRAGGFGVATGSGVGVGVGVAVGVAVAVAVGVDVGDTTGDDTAATGSGTAVAAATVASEVGAFWSSGVQAPTARAAATRRAKDA
jgi:hypothetical protein